jgi:hypothetical protein
MTKRYCKQCKSLIFFSLEDIKDLTHKDIKNKKQSNVAASKSGHCSECYILSGGFT